MSDVGVVSKLVETIEHHCRAWYCELAQQQPPAWHHPSKSHEVVKDEQDGLAFTCMVDIGVVRSQEDIERPSTPPRLPFKI